MSDLPRHPEDFVRLCERAIRELEGFPSAPAEERGARLARIRRLLDELGDRMAALDIRSPDFPDEQASLADATSALLALDMDRGGPHARRYTERIVADLRRIASG